MKETVKYCGKCRQRKPIDAFAKCRTLPDGRQSHCRACQAIYQKTYRGTPRQKADDDALTRRDTWEMRDRQPAASTPRVPPTGSAEQE